MMPTNTKERWWFKTFLELPYKQVLFEQDKVVKGILGDEMSFTNTETITDFISSIEDKTLESAIEVARKIRYLDVGNPDHEGACQDIVDALEDLRK